MALRNRFYRQLKGHYIIGGSKRLAVFKINFVLPRSAFMMGSLDLKAHILQSQANIPPGVFPPVHRAQLKIASVVDSGGRGIPLIVSLEQEEFALRTHVKGKAHFSGFCQDAAQNASGVALKGSSVGFMDVADQAGYLAVLLLPGIDHKAV